MGCMLPASPLEVLDFTKSPLVAGEMNKANPRPLPTHHLSLGVVLSLEDKMGKYNPNTSIYVSDTDIIPRTETLKLPLSRPSPLSPRPVRFFFQSLSVLTLLLIPLSTL